MIPEEVIREIRERADILRVVSEYVGLKKSGVNYLGLCPFHSEKTPSFNVNTAKGIYHCFGCGVGGDAVSFIMRIEGLSFPEALKFLAKRVGVVIPEKPLTASERRLAGERENFFELHEIAARFYETMLRNETAGELCRVYLQKRNVDSDTARAYRLGYAPDSWDSLVRYLEGKKFPLEVAENAGLIKRKDRGGYYDGFRNRLLFPITDIQGRVIGFGGRVLDDSLPKYLNSPESVVYRKSDVLFGLSMAKQAIRERNDAFIVEGYFDHLALYRAGVRNVVATCGTALTEGHLKLLRRFASKAYLLFDADSAGKKATIRAMETFLEEDFPACVVQMPSGEDPDSFLEKFGSEAFSGLVEGAQPVFGYFFKDLCRSADLGSIEGKVAVLDELAPRLRKIADGVERDLYVREIARFLDVGEHDVRNKMGKASSTISVHDSRKEMQKKRISPEEMLLALMSKFPEVARQVVDFGPERIFRSELLPAALYIISHAPSGVIDWSQVLDTVDPLEERNRLASLLIMEDHLEEMDPGKAFDQCRRALERDSLREIKELSVMLSRVEPGSDAYHSLLHKIDFLRARKSQLT